MICCCVSFVCLFVCLFFCLGQGVWMGIYLSAGSLSRIVGPLYLSWVYTVHGTWATCGSLIAILAVLFVVNVVLSDHLTPLLERDRSAETTSDATR